MTGTGAFTFVESAAASAVGTDMAQNEFWRMSSVPRIITGFGIVGSTNAGDAAVELLVNGQTYVKQYNTTGGANKVPSVETDILRVGIPVPAGALIQCKIVDAGVGNVLVGTVQLQPMPMRPAFRGRSSFRGRRSYRRY